MEEKKSFKGEYYYKRFSQNYYLVTHQRTHNGEKPFKFDQCDKSFAQNSNLAKHQREHNGENPFKCDYCGKHFFWEIYCFISQKIQGNFI